jgi:hypothetical protein
MYGLYSSNKMSNLVIACQADFLTLLFRAYDFTITKCMQTNSILSIAVNTNEFITFLPVLRCRSVILGNSIHLTTDAQGT